MGTPAPQLAGPDAAASSPAASLPNLTDFAIVNAATSDALHLPAEAHAFSHDPILSAVFTDAGPMLHTTPDALWGFDETIQDRIPTESFSAAGADMALLSPFAHSGEWGHGSFEAFTTWESSDWLV